MKKVKKENKEKIMEMIKKAGDPDNYKISWDVKGVPYKIQKKADIKKGGKSRASGSQFELKVRKDLESQGRIVDKWTNNVEFEKDANKQIIPQTGKIIISRKYNPFKKMLIVGTGFPDFISIKKVTDKLYSVIGVEVKMNGILSKIEKQKCAWYLKEGVFSEIWIAKKWTPKGVPSSTKSQRDDPSKDDFGEPSDEPKKDLSEEGKKKGQIEYDDFVERYGDKYN